MTLDVYWLSLYCLALPLRVHATLRHGTFWKYLAVHCNRACYLGLLLGGGVALAFSTLQMKLAVCTSVATCMQVRLALVRLSYYDAIELTSTVAQFCLSY